MNPMHYVVDVTATLTIVCALAWISLELSLLRLAIAAPIVLDRRHTLAQLVMQLTRRMARPLLLRVASWMSCVSRRFLLELTCGLLRAAMLGDVAHCRRSPPITSPVAGSINGAADNATSTHAAVAREPLCIEVLHHSPAADCLQIRRYLIFQTRHGQQWWADWPDDLRGPIAEQSLGSPDSRTKCCRRDRES
jgi:hypothetical protein